MQDNEPKQHSRFLHRISKSTLRYGMAVPLESQGSWMGDIPKGSRIPIKLRFHDTEILADLTRLNNARGHLQIRYDKKINEPFRNLLRNLRDTAEDSENVIVEVIETGHHQFLIVPFFGVAHEQPTLSICSPIFHRFNGAEILSCPEFANLSKTMLTINFEANLRQRDYNSIIRNRLIEQSWISEQPLLKEMGLRCDFEKNGVWVEIEFGNARGYYQDYIKFLIAAKYRKYQFGVLVCPTAAFAGYLCELGRLHAQEKRSNNDKATYSGMMTYEKAIKELPYMTHFLNNKLVIAGLEVQGTQFP